MAVRFGERGSPYEVHSEQGEVYAVDVETWTCTCADWTDREPTGGCKHLRRLDFEIRTGTVPRPNGTFRR